MAVAAGLLITRQQMLDLEGAEEENFPVRELLEREGSELEVELQLLQMPTAVAELLSGRNKPAQPFTGCCSGRRSGDL